jgi:hypothetical protein
MITTPHQPSTTTSIIILGIHHGLRRRQFIIARILSCGLGIIISIAIVGIAPFPVEPRSHG